MIHAPTHSECYSKISLFSNMKDDGEVNSLEKHNTSAIAINRRKKISELFCVVLYMI